MNICNSFPQEDSPGEKTILKAISVAFRIVFLIEMEILIVVY